MDIKRYIETSRNERRVQILKSLLNSPKTTIELLDCIWSPDDLKVGKVHANIKRLNDECPRLIIRIDGKYTINKDYL